MYFLEYSSPPLSPKAFASIMDLCLQRSRFFSLTYHSYPWKTNELITELFKYRCRRIKTSQWFSYYRLPDNPLEIFLYPSNSSTLTILKKHYTGLFLDNVYDKSLQWKQSLEDLCIFGEDKLIMGTVSHEMICNVYPPDENFRTQLMSDYGYWRYRDDDREQICLSDYITFKKKSREKGENTVK